MKKNSKRGLPKTLTVEQVREIMGVSVTSAYELTRKKGFPAIRVGRRIVIPQDSFIKWLESEDTWNE